MKEVSGRIPRKNSGGISEGILVGISEQMHENRKYLLEESEVCPRNSWWNLKKKPRRKSWENLRRNSWRNFWRNLDEGVLRRKKIEGTLREVPDRTILNKKPEGISREILDGALDRR